MPCPYWTELASEMMITAKTMAPIVSRLRRRLRQMSRQASLRSFVMDSLRSLSVVRGPLFIDASIEGTLN